MLERCLINIFDCKKLLNIIAFKFQLSLVILTVLNLFKTCILEMITCVNNLKILKVIKKNYKSIIIFIKLIVKENVVANYQVAS